MSSSPKQNEDRMKNAVSVWRSLHSTKKFPGLSVDEFEAELMPCFDERAAVEDAEAKVTGAINTRNEADEAGLALVDRFVAAVKGDAAEGENSEVLEAPGYVIPSKRKSGLHRKSGVVTLAKAA